MATRSFVARVLFSGLLTLTLARTAAAEEFFAGKTIQIIVGLAPGGGFDVYARLLARHMGKYIPGNPNFVVVNMPGAGSMNSVNHLYNRVKPDGLTMGTFLGHVVWSQVFDRPGVQFDARQLRWLGIPAARTGACVLSKASGITSIEKWKAAKEPVQLGAAGIATESYNTARILKDVLGLPIHIVSAYSGSQPIRLAVESGEVAGVCLQWEALLATWRYSLDAGDVLPVLQFRRTPHPDLPSVPMAVSLAKTDADRELLTAGIEHSNSITTSYALPPQTPVDRVELLRKAFMSAMTDPVALAEAETMHLDVGPISGVETEKMIGELFTLKTDVREKLRTILYGEEGTR